MQEDLQTIEDLITEEDQKKLILDSTGNPKVVLLRRIQESLASSNIPTLSRKTKSRMECLLSKLAEFIS